MIGWSIPLIVVSKGNQFGRPLDTQDHDPALPSTHFLFHSQTKKKKITGHCYPLADVSEDTYSTLIAATVPQEQPGVKCGAKGHNKGSY